jgi:hypothetical protein
MDTGRGDGTERSGGREDESGGPQVRKKLGFCVAAVLAALSGQAQAKDASIYVDGQCDIFSVHWSPGTLVSLTQLASGCSQKFGVGVVGKSFAKHIRHALLFAVQDPDNPATTLFYQFSSPLADGGTWEEYASADGEADSLIASGTYHLESQP